MGCPYVLYANMKPNTVFAVLLALFVDKYNELNAHEQWLHTFQRVCMNMVHKFVVFELIIQFVNRGKIMYSEGTTEFTQ